MPQTVAAIDALATELLKDKTGYVSGVRASKITESAWGPSSHPPMLNAGVVWRERFREFCPKVARTQT